MQVLVTSPIPSHPQNHGNRARVFSLCKLLQSRGYKIHFVYGGFEGLSDKQELAMREAWDHVYVLPHNPAAKKQSRRNHHLIDDWYIPEVGEITERIFKIWKIDIALANYVWFSRWLEDVPAGIPRYLDTHDLFSGRNKSLQQEGLDARWYSTTVREEKKAFKRADVVLAIQKEEAATFTSMGADNIATLGHYVPAEFLPFKKPSHTKGGKAKLQVGYLASNNPINQHSLHLLWKELKERRALMDAVDFHLAGAVSICGVADTMPATRHGFVESPAAFYRDIDIILNPNIGGTGLKIKSVEALSYGKPLLATADAMTGISSPSPHHQYATISALLDGLQALTTAQSDIQPLAEIGQRAFTVYQHEQDITLDTLFPSATATTGTSGGDA